MLSSLLEWALEEIAMEGSLGLSVPSVVNLITQWTEKQGQPELDDSMKSYIVSLLCNDPSIEMGVLITYSATSYLNELGTKGRKRKADKGGKNATFVGEKFVVIEEGLRNEINVWEEAVNQNLCKEEGEQMREVRVKAKEDIIFWKMTGALERDPKFSPLLFTILQLICRARAQGITTMELERLTGVAATSLFYYNKILTEEGICGKIAVITPGSHTSLLVHRRYLLENAHWTAYSVEPSAEDSASSSVTQNQTFLDESGNLAYRDIPFEMLNNAAVVVDRVLGVIRARPDQSIKTGELMRAIGFTAPSVRRDRRHLAGHVRTLCKNGVLKRLEFTGHDGTWITLGDGTMAMDTDEVDQGGEDVTAAVDEDGDAEGEFVNPESGDVISEEDENSNLLEWRYQSSVRLDAPIELQFLKLVKQSHKVGLTFYEISSALSNLDPRIVEAMVNRYTSDPLPPHLSRFNIKTVMETFAKERRIRVYNLASWLEVCAEEQITVPANETRPSDGSGGMDLSLRKTYEGWDELQKFLNNQEAQVRARLRLKKPANSIKAPTAARTSQPVPKAEKRKEVKIKAPKFKDIKPPKVKKEKPPPTKSYTKTKGDGIPLITTGAETKGRPRKYPALVAPDGQTRRYPKAPWGPLPNGWRFKDPDYVPPPELVGISAPNRRASKKSKLTDDHSTVDEGDSKDGDRLDGDEDEDEVIVENVPSAIASTSTSQSTTSKRKRGSGHVVPNSPESGIEEVPPPNAEAQKKSLPLEPSPATATSSQPPPKKLKTSLNSSASASTGEEHPTVAKGVGQNGVRADLDLSLMVDDDAFEPPLVSVDNILKAIAETTTSHANEEESVSNEPANVVAGPSRHSAQSRTPAPPASPKERRPTKQHILATNRADTDFGSLRKQNELLQVLREGKGVHEGGVALIRAHYSYIERLAAEAREKSDMRVRDVYQVDKRTLNTLLNKMEKSGKVKLIKTTFPTTTGGWRDLEIVALADVDKAVLDEFLRVARDEAEGAIATKVATIKSLAEKQEKKKQDQLERDQSKMAEKQSKKRQKLVEQEEAQMNNGYNPYIPDQPPRPRFKRSKNAGQHPVFTAPSQQQAPSQIKPEPPMVPAAVKSAALAVTDADDDLIPPSARTADGKPMEHIVPEGKMRAKRTVWTDELTELVKDIAVVLSVRSIENGVAFYWTQAPEVLQTVPPKLIRIHWKNLQNEAGHSLYHARASAAYTVLYRDHVGTEKLPDPDRKHPLKPFDIMSHVKFFRKNIDKARLASNDLAVVHEATPNLPLSLDRFLELYDIEEPSGDDGSNFDWLFGNTQNLSDEIREQKLFTYAFGLAQKSSPQSLRSESARPPARLVGLAAAAVKMVVMTPVKDHSEEASVQLLTKFEGPVLDAASTMLYENRVITRKTRDEDRRLPGRNYSTTDSFLEQSEGPVPPSVFAESSDVEEVTKDSKDGEWSLVANNGQVAGLLNMISERRAELILPDEKLSTFVQTDIGNTKQINDDHIEFPISVKIGSGQTASNELLDSVPTPAQLAFIPKVDPVPELERMGLIVQELTTRTELEVQDLISLHQVVRSAGEDGATWSTLIDSLAPLSQSTIYQLASFLCRPTTTTPIAFWSGYDQGRLISTDFIDGWTVSVLFDNSDMLDDEEQMNEIDALTRMVYPRIWLDQKGNRTSEAFERAQRAVIGWLMSRPGLSEDALRQRLKGILDRQEMYEVLQDLLSKGVAYRTFGAKLQDTLAEVLLTGGLDIGWVDPSLEADIYWELVGGKWCSPE